jgi:hypothetical protein
MNKEGHGRKAGTLVIGMEFQPKITLATATSSAARRFIGLTIKEMKSPSAQERIYERTAFHAKYRTTFYAMCLAAIISFSSGCSVSSLTHQRRHNMESKLELAIDAAIAEARKCGVNLDAIEMHVAIVDSTYKIEMFNKFSRGGGAIVVVERETTKIINATCLQ